MFATVFPDNVEVAFSSYMFCYLLGTTAAAMLKIYRDCVQLKIFVHMGALVLSAGFYLIFDWVEKRLN